MKTFLGFTLGLFIGIFGWTAALIFVDDGGDIIKDCHDMCKKY